MDSKELRGIIPPIITPVDDHENVDEAALCRLIDATLEKGVHGIFVAGSNGESVALTEEQREKVVSVTLRHVAGRVPVTYSPCLKAGDSRIQTVVA